MCPEVGRSKDEQRIPRSFERDGEVLEGGGLSTVKILRSTVECLLSFIRRLASWCVLSSPMMAVTCPRFVPSCRQHIRHELRCRPALCRAPVGPAAAHARCRILMYCGLNEGEGHAVRQRSCMCSVMPSSLRLTESSSPDSGRTRPAQLVHDLFGRMTLLAHDRRPPWSGL